MQNGKSIALTGRYSRLLFTAFAVLFFAHSASTQTNKSEPIASKPAATTVCSDKVKAARAAGFNDGIKEAESSCGTKVKEGQSSAFLSGFTAGESLAITDLKSREGKIPISIIVENNPQADSYRFAAAEVLATYFSQHYVVAQGSALFIYINVNELEDRRAASYHVELEIINTASAKIGDKTVPLEGFFVVDNAGGVTISYSQEHLVQTVKESIYKVLTKGDAALFPPPK